MNGTLQPPGWTERVRAASALVLAPHHDDEVLGCGGLAAQLAAAGAAVRVLFLTDGGGGAEEARGRTATPTAAGGGRRPAGSARSWASPAAITSDLPDGALDHHLDEAAEGIRRAILTQRPELLLVPSPLEISRDHRAAFAALHRLLAPRARGRRRPGAAARPAHPPLRGQPPRLSRSAGGRRRRGGAAGEGDGRLRQPGGAPPLLECRPRAAPLPHPEPGARRRAGRGATAACASRTSPPAARPSSSAISAACPRSTRCGRGRAISVDRPHPRPPATCWPRPWRASPPGSTAAPRSCWSTTAARRRPSPTASRCPWCGWISRRPRAVPPPPRRGWPPPPATTWPSWTTTTSPPPSTWPPWPAWSRRPACASPTPTRRWPSTSSTPDGWVCRERRLPYSRDFDPDVLLVDNYIPFNTLLIERRCSPRPARSIPRCRSSRTGTS